VVKSPSLFTSEMIEAEAPLPPEFQMTLAALRQHRPRRGN